MKQVKTVREAVTRIREKFGGKVFKPGYPTGRNEYMILSGSGHQKAILAALDAMGIASTRSPCGHDYNYNGDLYKLKLKEVEMH